MVFSGTRERQGRIHKGVHKERQLFESESVVFARADAGYILKLMIVTKQDHSQPIL